MAEKPYTYSLCPLEVPENELRLLEIVQGRETRVHCRLSAWKLPTPNRGSSSSTQSDSSSPREVDEYETLSYCWGINEGPMRHIIIIHGNDHYQFPVTPNLESALMALRDNRQTPEEETIKIWIDFICIDQDNHNEKNQQVPMMARIYGESRRVRVWLGDADDKTETAFNFIKDDILQLGNLKDLIKDASKAKGWEAMTSLIKRPWFSRRWIIQEIALAREAILHCGHCSVSWPDFADAVSLFSEIETGTRMLTQIMKSDKAFEHKPNFFGHVPAYSATRLVEFTNDLFHRLSNGQKEAKLSLEHLVSEFYSFKATEPRDTIYSLLAISKDTLPKTNPTVPKAVEAHVERARKFMAETVAKHLKTSSYHVNYELPVSDVFVEFVKFAINGADKSRALDIVCRPWAPQPDENARRVRSSKRPWLAIFPDTDRKNCFRVADEEHFRKCKKLPEDRNIRDSLPSWIRTLDESAYGMKGDGERMDRKNADTLVGRPNTQAYRAAGNRHVGKALHFETGVFKGSRYPELNYRHYHSLCVEGFILGEVDRLSDVSQLGNIPRNWAAMGGESPDWVRALPDEYWRTLVADRGPSSGNAPRYYHRMLMYALRQGIPGDSTDTREIVDQKHKVIGDVLQRVQSVIWNKKLMRMKWDEKGTEEGGETTQHRPKDSHPEGSDEEEDEEEILLEESHLWRLGLAPEAAEPGDKICILYGCSVPVILREFKKTKTEMAAEKEQWFEKMKEILIKFNVVSILRKRVYLKKKAIAEGKEINHYLGGRCGVCNCCLRLKRKIGSEDDMHRAKKKKKRGGEQSKKNESSSAGGAEPPNANDTSKLRRDHGKYYQLIGECYVNGMMNGEAIHYERQERLFEIR